jgi:hypothetical protein
MATRDKIKGFIWGIAAASLLISTSAVLASPVKKQLEAYYNNIKIVVDGNAVTPTDAQGQKVEPFIYEGTTYLPIRAIGQAIGKEVSWDSSTNTVYIGKNPGGTGLTSLPYARTGQNSYIEIDKWTDHSYDNIKGRFSIANKEYSTGIGVHDDYIGPDRGYVVYNLNSQYKTLTGLLGVDDDYKNNGNSYMIMTISGDGKELYRSPKVVPGDNPVEVNVDVSGVNQITIAFDSEGKDGGYAVFANPVLR